MDRLQAMHCFVRVVKLGSFSAAARELGLDRANLHRLAVRLGLK